MIFNKKVFFTETLQAKHSLLFSLAQTGLLHAKRGRLLRKAASLQPSPPRPHAGAPAVACRPACQCRHALRQYCAMQNQDMLSRHVRTPALFLTRTRATRCRFNFAPTPHNWAKLQKPAKKSSVFKISQLYLQDKLV